MDQRKFYSELFFDLIVIVREWEVHSNQGVQMERLFPKPIHGILERETYSWDEMERRGWNYNGVTNSRTETLELWNNHNFLAIANLDGKILSIRQQ